MSKNDLTLGYRINSLPLGVSRARFYDEAMRAIQRGDGELPDDWDVDWLWRNSPKQDLREAPLSTAVRESRGGFLSLMIRRLERDSGRSIEIPEAEEDIIEQIEEEEEETAERRREEKPGEATRERKARRSTRAKKAWQRKKAAERREFKRRSAAARKGWETRRRHMREAARAAKKRSAAARRAALARWGKR